MRAAKADIFDYLPSGHLLLSCLESLDFILVFIFLPLDANKSLLVKPNMKIALSLLVTPICSLISNFWPNIQDEIYWGFWVKCFLSDMINTSSLSLSQEVFWGCHGHENLKTMSDPLKRTGKIRRVWVWVLHYETEFLRLLTRKAPIFNLLIWDNISYVYWFV